MRRKTIPAIVVAWLLCIALSMPILAAEADSAGNVFMAENSVVLSELPFFDAWALGQDVVVEESRSKGSVGVMGQSVKINNSYINNALYAGGGTIILQDTAVLGNMYMAGNNIKMSGIISCNGAYLAGRNVTFAGNSNILNIVAETVKIDGNISGDAYVKADKIEISPATVISGKLIISSVNEPAIPDTAQIGDYSFKKENLAEEGKNIEKEETASPIQKKLTSTLYWFAARAALGMILCWLFSKHLIQAAEYLKTSTGSFIGTAIGGFLLVPIAAIILCFTYVLLPVSILALIIYGILMFVGISFTGASLPRLFLPSMNIFLSSLIGIAVLSILGALPFVGWIVVILSGMYLLGYVLMYLWSNRLKRVKKTEE